MDVEDSIEEQESTFLSLLLYTSAPSSAPRAEVTPICVVLSISQSLQPKLIVLINTFVSLKGQVLQIILYGE